MPIIQKPDFCASRIRRMKDLTQRNITKYFATMQEKEQNISPIKERILYLIDTWSISKRVFYSKTGISRGTLESKTGITEDTLAKFIATYPEISLDWLILGKGEISRSTPFSENPEYTKQTEVLLDAKETIIRLQQEQIELLKEKIEHLSTKK